MSEWDVATRYARNLDAAGWTIIRGALLPADISSARATVSRYFEHRRTAGLTPSRYGGASFPEIMSSGFGEIGEIFAMLSRSIIAKTVEVFYGAKAAIQVNHALARHYYPEAGLYDRVTPFHQDLSGIDARARLTSWIPLEDCGASAPGLEIVDVRLHELVAVDADGLDHGFGVSPQRVEHQYDTARLIHPEYGVGDVALFVNTTLHRTYVTPKMTASRLSVECRYLPQALLQEEEIGSANFVDL